MSDKYLLLKVESELHSKGHKFLGAPEVLRDYELFMSINHAEIAINPMETFISTFHAEEPIHSISLRGAAPNQREVLFVDHTKRAYRVFRVPDPLPGIEVLTVNNRENDSMKLFLDNGCVLTAIGKHQTKIFNYEARGFWHDILWVRGSEEREEALWAELAGFGIPERIVMTSLEDDDPIVEMHIHEVHHADDFRPFKVDAHYIDEKLNGPLVGELAGEEVIENNGDEEGLPDLGDFTTLLSGGIGMTEHIGWIISPSIVAELKKIINEIAGVSGTFDKWETVLGESGLVIDWYARAKKKLGGGTTNSLTIIREVLKSVIAMSILPDEIKDGKEPPEITGDNKKKIQKIIQDKSIKPADRFCAMLKKIKAPPGSTGTLFAPNEDDHDKLRKKVILEMVYEIFEKRYGALHIANIDTIKGSKWGIINYKFMPTKMKITPGKKPFKDFTVTQKGLRLDLQLDQVHVDLEYDISPSGSAGNTAINIFTLGASCLAEIQFGSGSVTAKSLLLSFDLIPKVKGKQIEFEIKLSNRSHADLKYSLSGSNIFTLGVAEVASLILTVTNAFEDDIFEAIGDELKNFGKDFTAAFPRLFNFADSPDISFKQEVIDSTPKKALLLGARLNLPKGTGPATVETNGPPDCKGDYAITLSTDYLNGVLYYRLDGYKKKAKSLKFNWKKYLSGKDLPSVKTPSGYKDNPGFPQDFQENQEEWKVTNPYLKLNKLSTYPGLTDPVGTVHMTVTYQLIRTCYGWCGSVKHPLYDRREWWLDQFDPRPGPGPEPGPGPVLRWLKQRIPIEKYLTIRYGMYQTAEGNVVSKSISEAELLALQGWFATNTQGIQEEELGNDFVPISGDIPSNPGWKPGKTSVGGVIVDWWSYPLSSKEHVNIHVDITANAYLNLKKKTPSFLPELDLCYDNLEVKVSKFSVSSSMSKLNGQEALFEKTVKAYIKPFFDKHLFSKKFSHPYSNLAYMFSDCGKIYTVPFRTGETPVIIGFNFSTLNSLSDSQKLSIQRDGQKLILNFRFMEGLPT